MDLGRPRELYGPAVTITDDHAPFAEITPDSDSVGDGGRLRMSDLATDTDGRLDEPVNISGISDIPYESDDEYGQNMSNISGISGISGQSLHGRSGKGGRPRKTRRAVRKSKKQKQTQKRGGVARRQTGVAEHARAEGRDNTVMYDKLIHALF